MIKEQLAALLYGRTYGDEITPAEEAQAEANGLVVIFGASDDLVELRGAIGDEIDAYDGTTFYLTPKGPLEKHSDCNCAFCGYEKERAKALKIKAVWGADGESPWTFETNAPHATFEITSEGERFCRGIVLHLDDIKPIP